MGDFIKTFKLKGNVSFKGMRDVAISLLPKDRVKCDKLHDDLNRGTGILDDDDHLNAYLLSYGKMHEAKLNEAFKCLPDINDVFCGETEIYDWGCGQGTASICLLDYLNGKNIKSDISCFHLIDPSSAAVDRAEGIVKCYNPNYAVKKCIKYFDDLVSQDFSKNGIKKIHLLSNILDVDKFDLAQFIHLFQKVFQKGENYFITVGPYYSNSRRVDEFIAAIEPDVLYAKVDKENGQWRGGWTISMRVFFKNFVHTENIKDIRKRIEDSHKEEQFFAGYILDAVSEEYKGTENAKISEELYNVLSVFDVKANVPLGKYNDCDSKLAVLANIISRGLPTKAPLILEEVFSRLFEVSSSPKKNDTLEYSSTHKISANEIYQALHIIDPRFNVDFYNGDMLESNFEKSFIDKFLKGTDCEYLIQILEPQRSLSSIVNIPDEKFRKDQRVDFAIEIPTSNPRTGFVIELDGAQYHSNIFERIYDERRDAAVTKEGWDTYRIDKIDNNTFLDSWEKETCANRYLLTLKSNYAKSLTGHWGDVLQIVLTPLAVARVERILVEAIMTNVLEMNAHEWNIVVVERDVPCAALAVKDLQEKLLHINALAGYYDNIPQINLEIISTEEFENSPLHLDYKPLREISQNKFDVCIDISVLLRDNIDALPLKVSADAVYIIRSAHYKKRERTVCAAENIQYPPLVLKDSAGKYSNIKEREDTLTYFLRDIFRKSSFRPGQLPILSRALSDNTTIGLLPTGGGKSLTYQLSCLLQPGVSIIVDPLVSLMVDQVRGLRDLRIDACDCVNSKMTGAEKAKKLNRLKGGEVLFMLLSPERFMMKNFRESLMTMTIKNHVYFSYGVIDEVHCVSEWGHDFRTSYLHLGRNMINFMQTKSGRKLSIIGLTATASFDVLADVERELTLGGNLSLDSEAIIRPESDTRPELTYRIVNVKSDFDTLRDPNEPYLLKAYSDWDLKNVVADDKRQALCRLLNKIPAEIEYLNNHEEGDSEKQCHLGNLSASDFYKSNEDGKYENAGIVFCPHKHAQFGVLDSKNDKAINPQSGIATFLQSAKEAPEIKIGTFVGGAPIDMMKPFNDNEMNLMVATKAFGMGIDKPNVRFTININHPSSIESFVQEAGRAGRDKRHAISYILYDSTKYVHFTADKIEDLKRQMGNDVPYWLDQYNNKFVLYDEFDELFASKGASEEQTSRMKDIIMSNDWVESVDKDIVMYFHNNSFRGAFKEKVMLYEMTDRMLNVKPTFLLEIQGRLRDITGNEDLRLKVNVSRNTMTIVSAEDASLQYGYIYLNTLWPTIKHINFDEKTCYDVCSRLIDILMSYPNHSATDLLKPLDGKSNIEEGIYSAIERVDENDYIFVTVSWENQIMQDFDEFENKLIDEIDNIACSKGWNGLRDKNVFRKAIRKINDFYSLLSAIARNSNEKKWLEAHNDEEIYVRLRRIFASKRDKDDTDKAIYRMCCIGLVEDVTIDYFSETYELKIRKRSDEEYRQSMLDFFKKYYSQERAEIMVAEIDNHKGRYYLDKCLGYLTEFIYENLEKKRYRAISDMQNACEDSISKKEYDDKKLKEFIHLYFNSKYARLDYNFAGKSYSLTKDTNPNKSSGNGDDFQIVRKYIDIVKIDTSGSEVDNVKHLYGATLLCLRDRYDNPSLQLLLAYCIIFLGIGDNETLKVNAYNAYIEGLMGMFKLQYENFWDIVNDYNNLLSAKIHPDESFVKTDIIDKGKEAITLFIHTERLDDFKKKYLN